MPITDVELHQLARQAADGHSEAAVALACLVHLSTARLAAHGSLRSAGLSRLHDLGMLCVRTYAQRIGVPWADVKAAIRALHRAGDTAGYLHRLPD